MHRPTLLRLTLLSALTLGTLPLQSQGTLYQRLGGYDAIAAFVDDFMIRFDGDSALAPYLGGINAKAGARIRQHFVDFICAEAEGPCLYTGQDMTAAHAGLRIPGGHFDAVMTHMRAALVKTGAPAMARDELLARLQKLRHEVVTAAAP